MFNLTTYPHLVGLFNELGVASERSDMSFALSTDDVEWGSLGLGAVFAQPGNAVRPAFLNMIREVFRFGKRAPEVLKPENASTFEGMTLGEYLARERYSVFFRENYVVPMCAAIWSCSDRDTMAFPVITLIRFWVNHHLLNVVERPLWRVVKGRSKAYVDAVVAALPEGSARLRTAVVAAERLAKGGVELTFETRSATGKKTTKKKQTFDDVIFACHSDQTLAILGDAAEPAERAALAAIKYQPNEVYLHSDPSLMPRARRAWASWNCLKGSRGTSDADDSVCVSYWVNLLQNLPEGVPDSVRDAQPPRPPAADTIQHHVTLAHPLFNQAAIDAQKTIADAQGLGGFGSPARGAGTDFTRTGSSRRWTSPSACSRATRRDRRVTSPPCRGTRDRATAPQPQHEGVHPTVRAGRGILGAARSVLPHDSSGRIRARDAGEIAPGGGPVPRRGRGRKTPRGGSRRHRVRPEHVFALGAPRGHRPRRELHGRTL